MKHIKLLLLVTSFCTINFIQGQTSSKSTSEEQMWRESGYRNAIVSEFIVDEFYTGLEHIAFTHAMDLTLVNLRGSGWGQELVNKTIKRAAEVYATIGIKFSSVKYVEADPPGNRVDISQEENHDSTLAIRTPIKSRPVIFFIRSNVEGDTAFAWPLDSADPPLADVGFITSLVNTKEYKDERTPQYSPTSHEIAHLLSNSQEHIKGEEYNILSDYYNRLDSSITEEQSDTFKRSPLLRKL